MTVLALSWFACRRPTTDDTPRPHSGPTDDGPTAETAGTSTAETGVDPRETLEMGVFWGMPAVLTGRTVDHRPYNIFPWENDLPDPTSGHGNAPNPDVLYAITTLDLRAEPVVMHVPELTDRYWCVQLTTFWTETFRYLGTRTTGGHEALALLTPPGWEGELPEGMIQVPFPTTQAAMMSRVQVRGPEDLPAAVAATEGFWMRPLSRVLGTEPPEPAPPIPIEGEPDDTATNGILFWDELGDVLIGSPPDPAEQPWLDSLEPYGIGPGRHPSEEVTDPELRAMLDEVVAPTMTIVRAGVDWDDWEPILDFGVFEGDIVRRAIVVADAWITHEPAEAIYVISPQLEAGPTYRLHFPADQLPPVEAFWSLTGYTTDEYLMANAIDRYSVSSMVDLDYNPDGSLDLIIAAEDPGGAPPNWLPTLTEGRFYLMMRAYVPKPAMLDGTWKPPPIVRDP